MIQSKFVPVIKIHMEMSINCSKWLSYIVTQKGQSHNGYTIPTIMVESPTLTASYYKEYLGFNILFMFPFRRRWPIIIQKKSNLVLIKAINSEITVNCQRLTIYMSRIDLEYSKLFRMVRVVKPFSNESDKKFIIKDCNGIEIVYCSS